MTNDISKYDAVLVCDVNEFINEDYGDPRSYTGAGYGKDVGKVPYFWYDDPTLHSANAFLPMDVNVSGILISCNEVQA